MPIKMDVISDYGLFVMQALGKLDDQTIAEFQASIKDIPNYSSTLNTLFDFRLVTENLLSPETLIRLSSITPFDSSVKRAYVVRDEKAGMLATLFGSTTSESEHFFVTYNLEDACDWLGIAYNDIIMSSVYLDDK